MIVDFIAELTILDLEAVWCVVVDGLSCNSGEGIGVRIVTHDQRTYEHSIHLQFPTSNNVIQMRQQCMG